MSAAMHRLVVICLSGSDVAQTGTTAHHVDQNRGNFRPGNIGDTFHHQANTRAGRGRHDANACASRAVHHVDRTQF